MVGDDAYLIGNAQIVVHFAITVKPSTVFNNVAVILLRLYFGNHDAWSHLNRDAVSDFSEPLHYLSPLLAGHYVKVQPQPLLSSSSVTVSRHASSSVVSLKACAADDELGGSNIILTRSAT
jgi:hypothetical protein